MDGRRQEAQKSPTLRDLDTLEFSQKLHSRYNSYCSYLSSVLVFLSRAAAIAPRETFLGWATRTPRSRTK